MNKTLTIFIFILIYFSPVFYQIYIAIKNSKKDKRIYLKKLKNSLKWSLIILLPFVAVIAILSDTNYLDYEAPLTYDKVDQISFKNFRGIELFKMSLYGNKRFAYVKTSIETDLQSDSLKVQALFYPSSSFVFKNNNNSAELLNHEIYHFKITELFARKIKRKISNIEKPTKKKIYSILEEFKTDEKSFQEKYDYETFHSYVYGQQKKYEKIIDSSLNSLAEYKNPKIYINETN